MPEVLRAHCIGNFYQPKGQWCWAYRLSACFRTSYPEDRHSRANSFIVFLPLESCLEVLEIRFPREPLHTAFLLPVLKASKSLQQLSLDSATLPCPQELGLLLEVLKGTVLTRGQHHWGTHSVASMLWSSIL